MPRKDPLQSECLYGKNKHHAVVEIEYAARNRCRMNEPIRITINHLQTLYFYLCV